MPAEPRPPCLLSRRTVAAAAGILPLLGAASAAPGTHSSDVEARCRAWLSGEAELDRLNGRWSSIEGRAMKRRGPGQGAEVPFGTPLERAEMAELEGRLAELYSRQAKRLEALANMKASCLAEAAGLMNVAAHLLRYEGHPSHRLIGNALTAVAAQARV